MWVVSSVFNFLNDFVCWYRCFKLAPDYSFFFWIMTCFSYCLLPDTKSAVQSLDSVSKNLHVKNYYKTCGCKRSRISVKCFLKTCKSHFYRSLRYVLNFFFYKLFWSLHCLISFNVCYLSKKKKLNCLRHTSEFSHRELEVKYQVTEILRNSHNTFRLLCNCLKLLPVMLALKGGIRYLLGCLISFLFFYFWIWIIKKAIHLPF